MAPFDLTRRQLLRLAGAAATTGVAVMAVEGAVVEPQHLELERIDVPLRRLPPELNGLTIAQLSDLHYEPGSSARVIKVAVEMANRLNADLVVLTGDYITVPLLGDHLTHRARALEGAEPCAKLLAGLHAKHGVFAVLGNHDQHADADIVTQVLKRNGLQVLRNQCVPLERDGARVWLTGLNDLVDSDPPDLRKLLSQIPRDEPNVLLVHEPDFADHVADHAVDLQLSGHSHGGQVRLPVFGPLYLPEMGRKYPWGLRRVGTLTLYTSRGIGTIRVPLRLNCPPEITLLTLRSAQAQTPIS